MFSLNLITPIGDAPFLNEYDGPVPRIGDGVVVSGVPFEISEIDYQFAPPSPGAAYELRAIDIYLELPVEEK